MTSEPNITNREAEILSYLAEGYSNKDVARMLDISLRTIETHRLNLRRKTNTGRLHELIKLARAMGLKPPIHDLHDQDVPLKQPEV